MYFNSETHARIITRFHFALNEPGYLFLGRAELLLTHSNLFKPWDFQGCIFAKVPFANARERLLAMAQNGNNDMNNTFVRPDRLQQLAFDASSNEELETTNEELQSTNEELETMNEELQSLNEELETVNEELRQRTDEVNHANAFLQSVVSSLRSGAVVVNQHLNILIWNHRAEDLWGLRADEVRGVSLLNLDIGLPVHQLRPVIRACLSSEADHKEILLDATNRRGKPIKCRISCSPLFTHGKECQGAILLMDEEER